MMKRPPRHNPSDETGPSPAWRNLFDVELIEQVLCDAARQGKALSYAETLNRLGYNFSRPKMRALCAALDEVDNRARRRGEPALAVLVVRQSDGLPGAGWWATKDRRRYHGPWEGAQAEAYVRKTQAKVFAYWKATAATSKKDGSGNTYSLP